MLPSHSDRVSGRLFMLCALALACLAGGAPVAQAVDRTGAIVSANACTENEIYPNDDGSGPEVTLPKTLNFYGREYSSLWVNNNGNVTFDGALGTFTPFPIRSAGRAIIAPFFADVDTRGLSQTVRYGYGNTVFEGHPAFCVNWIDVGYFPSQSDKLNSFQLLLVDRSDAADGDFDIVFNYGGIEWETGGASGGTGGLGGSSARAGFANGDGTDENSYEIEGSAVNGALLDSDPNGLIYRAVGTTQKGRHLWRVRGGKPVLNQPPAADAGADVAVAEGGVGQLDATGSTDPDQDPLAYSWRRTDSSGTAVVLSSTTADKPTFDGVDDGSAEFAVTVDDSKGGTDEDRVRVRTTNVAPVIAASNVSGVAGGATAISGTFSDPGVLDRHTATVNWGDGSPVEAVGVTDGNGWGTLLAAHRYANPGSFQITLKLRDDDGGEDSRQLSASIAAPTGLWSTSRSWGRGLNITGATTQVDGLVHADSSIKLLGIGHTLRGGIEYASSFFGLGLGNTLSPAPVKRPARTAPLTAKIADFRPGGRVAREAGTRYYDHSSECGLLNTVVLPAGQLPTGVHYASCSLHIAGVAVRGDVTFASEKQVHIDAGGAKLRPFTDGVLAISGSTQFDAVLVSSLAADLTGYLVATGDVRITGIGNTFRCGIQADEIAVVGASNKFTGADCSRPVGASATVNLVPSPKLGVTVDKPAAAPGDALKYRATLTNDGASFVVSGVLGAAGIASPSAKVASYALSVEYWSIPQNKWITLTAANAAAAGYTPAEAAPAGPTPALVVRPMSAPGVTAGPDGAIVGTTIADGSTAAWGYQLRLNLTPEQVRLLTDPTKTGAIRTASHLESSTSALRELYRYGDDFGPQLRAASSGGDLESSRVTLSLPDGTQQRFDQGSVAGLATIAPGASVAVDHDWTFPAPRARGPLEPSAAYVGRLKRIEAAGLRGVARAASSSGAIRIPLGQAVAASTAQVPVLTLRKTGPATLRAGDLASYQLAIKNTGNVAASSVVAGDAVGSAQTAVPVTGVPATLAPGASATGTASFTTPSGATAPVNDTGSVRWNDGNGNSYGPVDDGFVTKITTPPALDVTLDGRLTVDANGDGRASPGDEITYVATMRNEGTQPIAAPVLRVPLDPNVRVTAGSVDASRGTVTGTGADGFVGVALDELAGQLSVTLNFKVQIADPLPAGVTSVSMQGRVTSASLPEALSDDPFTAERGDASVMRVSRPAAQLKGTLTAAVSADADGNSQPSPGDTLRYTLDLENTGDATATGLRLVVPKADYLALVGGSITTTRGSTESVSGDVRVNVTSLPAGTTTRVTFDEKIAAQPPRGVASVSLQGTIASNEILSTLTDDPGTAEDHDATTTALTIAPRLVAEQTATLLTDADENGVVSPGDRLRYSVRILNDSTGAATDVVFRATPDPNVILVAGSGTTTQGTVEFTSPGVVASIGSMAGGAQVTVTYDVDLRPIISGGYQGISGQGSVSSPGLPTTQTDDPNVAGGGDATVTPVVGTSGAAPRLVVRKRDRLAVDADGDGEPSPGDTLSYEVNISNAGAGASTAVVMTDTPGANTTLVAGSVQNSSGATIETGNASGAASVKVRLDRLAAYSSSTTTFQVKVAETLPAGVDRVTNQASVESTELAPVLSVDPDAGGAAGPTETVLALPPLPAPAITGITPADGATVKGRAAVTAAIVAPTGQSVESYCVTLANADGDAPRTLKCGSGGTGTLATLDPTGLPNGQYRLTVRATASGGGAQEESVSVSVAGTAKLGRLNLTYRDLATTIDGIPVSIERSYDSFEKTGGRNSGIGWSVDVQTMKIQVPRPLGLGGWSWRSSGCSTLLGESFCLGRDFEDLSQHRVVLTWPGGKVDSWDFTPVAGAGGIYYDASASFTPRSGTTAQLRAVGDRTLQYWGDGNLYDAEGVELYNPTAFVVTTRDGRSYEIDRERGLSRLTTPQGTGFSIEADGIYAGDEHVVQFTRDSADRVTRVATAGQSPITYEYSAAGDLAKAQLGAARITSYAYDGDHNLTGVTGPDGPERTMEYDADGRLKSVTDGAGKRTEINASPADRTQAVSNARGTLTTLQSFDTDGNLTAVTEVADGTSRQTQYRYDSRGNRTATIDPLGRTTTITYDSNDLPTVVTLPGGSTVSVTRDSAGRPIEYVGPGGRLVKRLTLNAAGDPVAVETGLGRRIDNEYDDRGLLISSVDAQGQRVRYGYDADGNLTSVADPAGTTTFELDSAGRPVRTVDPIGGTVLQSYTPTGEIAAETDTRGITTTYGYDASGRIISSTVGGRTSSFDYDSAGRLSSTRDRNGELRSYSYDADGQLTAVDGPGDDDLTRRYDGFGRLRSASNRWATTDFDLDAADEVTALSTIEAGATAADRITYTYDALGRTTSQGAAWGTTTYRYTAQGDLDRIVDPVDGKAFDFSYDGAGRLTRLARPNGVATELSWDSADRVLNMTTRGPPGSVLSISGTEYGADGAPSAITDDSGRRLVAHDAAGRLVRAGAAEYSYDAGGNRLSGGATYNAQGLLTADDRARYTYDGEGRLTSRTTIATGRATTYAWNVFGQLTSVVNEASESVSYRYDALGRRIARVKGSQVDRRVFGLGDQELARSTNGGTRKITVSAPGLDKLLAVHSGSTAYYPVQDKLGNVTAVTSATGAVLERASYDPWGQPIGNRLTTMPFGFEGREWDPDALAYDFRARMYDASTGRFLSEDPQLSVNAYAWVDNSPLRLTDPTGEEYDLNSVNQVQVTAGEIVKLPTNANGAMWVYAWVRRTETGWKIYVGITNNLARRMAAHGVVTNGVANNSMIAVRFIGSRNLARFVEQALIKAFGGVGARSLGQMLNKINSISKSKIDEIAEEVLDDFERVGGKKIIDELKDWGDEFF